MRLRNLAANVFTILIAIGIVIACWFSSARYRCSWVTWAISCASTPATSFSSSAARIRPLYSAITPPGAAKALTKSWFSTTKVKDLSGRSLFDARR